MIGCFGASEFWELSFFFLLRVFLLSCLGVSKRLQAGRRGRGLQHGWLFVGVVWVGMRPWLWQLSPGGIVGQMDRWKFRRFHVKMNRITGEMLRGLCVLLCFLALGGVQNPEVSAPGSTFRTCFHMFGLMTPFKSHQLHAKVCNSTSSVLNLQPKVIFSAGHFLHLTV